MKDTQTHDRKNEHLDLALTEKVEHPSQLGWQAIRLIPRALPEISLDEVDTSIEFLGKRLAFPLIVGSMTGGTDRAAELNRRLARAAARAGIGMGLGSQRIMIEDPSTRDTFAMREVAPDLPLLIANVGAVQLNYGVGRADLDAVVDGVSADALVLHINAAQEAIQPEGDTNFRGLVAKMRELATETSYPVGVKEVGHGFTTRDVRLLSHERAFDFFESAGAGGTSWTRIEGKRAPDALGATLGELFAGWGVPAVTSLLACIQQGQGAPVIASGGIRSGLDGARAVAMGATAAAMALPLLKAADIGEEKAYEVMMAYQRAFATAMFLVGVRKVPELRQAGYVLDQQLTPEQWERGVS